MPNRSLLAVVCVALAALAITNLAELHAAPKKSPGAEPYQVTKQEWLAMKMQAYYGDGEIYDDGIAVSFQPHDEKSDTIVAVIEYSQENDNFSRTILQSRRERVKAQFSIGASGDLRSWAKLEEKLVDFDE